MALDEKPGYPPGFSLETKAIDCGWETKGGRFLCHHPSMQGVPHSFGNPVDTAEFRCPAHRSGVELYRAH
ncbi:MAG TPA: hypothetical protein VMA74_13695, partial [Dyella sp.]|nr:hypothetical protein [Dyella sp.]